VDSERLGLEEMTDSLDAVVIVGAIKEKKLEEKEGGVIMEAGPDGKRFRRTLGTRKGGGYGRVE